MESRSLVNPILKEGLLNMEKCNKISSSLLTQYKEHIMKLTYQNASLNKKLKLLSNIEEKYEDVSQQNEIYEKELKELEETMKMIEGQVDRKIWVRYLLLISQTKVQSEWELLSKETLQLKDCLNMAINGEEPDIDILLGFKPKWDLEEKEMEVTYQDLLKVRKSKWNEENIMRPLCN